MATVNQLKNQARREEQRENWSRAIELYTQALDKSRTNSQGLADVSLYNRIGDIYLRIGQKNTAVRYYEQAIELYAEQDLHTSAIALCNKVLRILPDRSTVFLQLGRLNLATNLIAEGREHYRRYATAMRKRGSEDAALEGLEELISAIGDAGTVALWAGWLAEASDADAAVARIEKLREVLERHGIDPDEVAAQVRSKTVVGFEKTGGEAPADDPLASAFLTFGDDEAAEPEGVGGGPTPPGEPADAVEPRPAEDAADGDERTDEVEDETGAPAVADRQPVPHEGPHEPGGDGTRDGEGEVAAPVEPGSVPWEQEVEEIIAEFDVAFEESWPGVDQEPEDRPAEPDRHVRSRPELESSETAPATWTQGAPRPPQAVEAAEFDELETAGAPSARAGTIDIEADEDAPGPDPDVEQPRVERETVETQATDVEPPCAETSSEDLESGGTAPEEGIVEADGWEEPGEVTAVSAEEEVESGIPEGVDALESIVDAAAALGGSGGFDAEPAVVTDEVPEPEPEEPSESDVEATVDPIAETSFAPPEPSDVDVAEAEETGSLESLEDFAESIATVDGSPPAEPASLSAETDEDPAADDAAWVDEARKTLEEREHAGADEDGGSGGDLDAGRDAEEAAAAAEASPEGSDAVPEPTSSGADLEAETIAVEWQPDETDPAEAVAASPDAGAPPANGRPEPRERGEVADPDEPRAPLAEPRLTVEEDPEDAFRDWVESASPGVLRRALSELENRKEHDRALAVIRRLTQLEETEVEFKIRYVRYLESLGRTEEAVEASLALAGRLEAEGRLGEARKAYERTGSLAPDDERALEGLRRLEGVEDESEEEAVQGPGPRRPYMPDHVNGTDRGSVMDRPMPSIPLPPEDRGAGPRPYSGVAGGSEAATDFEQLLSEFRAELHEKPARNDSSSRTELGARLKEMGRLDDAIRELQAAVREPSAPPLAFELLGEAFLEKGQARIAVRFLEKALGGLGQGDRDILGVLYQLGIAYESLNDLSKALICYERIFSVDIDYRDIQERILTCSA